MQYLPLFLLMMAVLIAAWFYLQRAKARDVTVVETTPTSPAEPAHTAAATTTTTTAPAADHRADTSAS